MPGHSKKSVRSRKIVSYRKRKTKLRKKRWIVKRIITAKSHKRRKTIARLKHSRAQGPFRTVAKRREESRAALAAGASDSVTSANDASTLAGAAFNGAALNGTALAGTALNGTDLNGTALNGTAPAGNILTASTLAIPNELPRTFENGYEQGFYDGGDGRLVTMMSPFTILPHTSFEEVVKLGLAQVSHRLHPLIDPVQLYQELEHALQHRIPMSVVRLGDGEMLMLAHDLVLSTDEANNRAPFLTYAGGQLPNHHARDVLAASIRRATVVGIPISRQRNYQELMYPAFQAHGIDYRQLRMTISTINYLLYETGYMQPLIEGREVLLVGNGAPALAEVLIARGIRVVGTVTPVHGCHDVDRVMGEVARHSFDIALVAAGIPAVIITERIANELGRVAIDFGHLADVIARGG